LALSSLFWVLKFLVLLMDLFWIKKNIVWTSFQRQGCLDVNLHQHHLILLSNFMPTRELFYQILLPFDVWLDDYFTWLIPCLILVLLSNNSANLFLLRVNHICNKLYGSFGTWKMLLDMAFCINPTPLLKFTRFLILIGQHVPLPDALFLDIVFS